jgi:hypothetical protein
MADPDSPLHPTSESILNTSRTRADGLARPWDAVLLDEQDPASLVAIARDRRLVLEDRRGPQWVDLCWVDEVALALIGHAVARRQGIDLVYPAPAGQLGVLLAAQLLLHRLVHGQRSSSLGLVTADTTAAARTWEALRIATTGSRESLSEVYPCFRAGPEGEAPAQGRALQGLIVGQRCLGWPVDYLVVDHLAGPVTVRGEAPTIEVFSDPRDPALLRAEREGKLIWGWSEPDLARWNQALEVRRDHTVPFSVASDRLEAIARGVDVTITVVHHPEAEDAVHRVREDLRLLRASLPDRTYRHVERGLSIAWHHLATLTSLPCTPRRFDRFSGLPPWAARATSTFEPELSAWARTLTGDISEYATVLASDIGDLRTALDRGNPLETAIIEASNSATETLVVTRTRTAARALLDALGTDPDAGGIRSLTVCPIRRLHRVGTWPRALVVGEPAPWDWHRLLSGLSTDVHVLALGEHAALESAAIVRAVRTARDHWGDDEVRGRTWRRLLGTDPPPAPDTLAPLPPRITTVDGAEYVPEPDPFATFASLFGLDPLDLGGEGPGSGIARRDEAGGWTAEVPAVAVTTDHGPILLEVGREVEVRSGPNIVDRRPENLRPGDVLLVGRRAGRVGLLTALEERLAHRPDLLAARLLVDWYHQLLRIRFAESGLTIAELHRRMVAAGFDKTSVALGSWVSGSGVMAPRDIADLRLLNQVLDLAMTDVQMNELFAGVRRRRQVRRAAGRELARAARSATAVEDTQRVDPETGLSIADLRDAIIEATVIAAEPRDGLVPLTMIGRLEEP